MPRVIHLVVMTDPVAKARPRVTMRRGKPHGYTPTKTANAEWRIRSAFLERFPDHQPLTGPIDLDVTAYLRMPASIPKKLRATARPVSRPDADNFLKTVLDALNGLAYADDSQVVSVSIEKAYVQDGVAPFWEIQIYALPESQPSATASGVAAHGSPAN